MFAVCICKNMQRPFYANMKALPEESGFKMKHAVILPWQDDRVLYRASRPSEILPTLNSQGPFSSGASRPAGKMIISSFSSVIR